MLSLLFDNKWSACVQSAAFEFERPPPSITYFGALPPSPGAGGGSALGCGGVYPGRPRSEKKVRVSYQDKDKDKGQGRRQ